MGNLKSYIDVGYLQSFWARVKNIITSSKYTLNDKSQTVKEAIDSLGTSKQDNITTGYGITKSGNQISAEVEYQMGQGCDDAARVILGGDWRLPTIQECYELIDGTTRTTKTIMGVTGIECVSKTNGAAIFFPFTGYMFGTSNDNQNDRVVVWTSELNTYQEDPSGYGNAENLDMFDGLAYVGDSPHYIGLQIRPVSKTEGVDMSFPSGTKWAASNLKLSGLAANPQTKGDFFAFAETMPKSDYSASTYKFGLPSNKYYPEGGKTIISLDGSDGSTYITSHGDELQKKLLPGENIVIHDDYISAVIPGQAEAEVLVEMYGGCITISDLEDLSTLTMPTGKFYSVYGSESGGVFAGGFEYEGKQISAGTFFKWNGERWIYDYDELLVSFKSNYLYSREWGAARQSWSTDTWTLLWEWTSNHAGSANKGKTGVGFELQSIGSDEHVGYSTKFIVDSRDGVGYRYINCHYLVPQKVRVSDSYFGSDSLDDLSTFVRVTYESSTATYRLYVRVWEDMNGLAGVNLLHPMWNIDEDDFAQPISEDYIRKPWAEIARGTQITDINYGIGGGGAPAEHTHKSSEITSMDGYSKAATASAIATSDTLNTAIGKLEKAIDGKTSNTGTVTSVAVKMNGSTKGTVTTSGTIDLGTVLTSFTEADPIFKASAAYGISAADITNWNGKTSNTGTVTSVAVKMNGSTKGTITSSGTIDLGTVLTSYTETDPVFAASPAYGITAADIANWNSKGSGSGTVTQVKVGNTAYDPSNGVISLPAYPTVSYPVTSVAGKTGAVTLAKGDVGLGNVGNFKAVSTVASQGLTNDEKANARANIGAGTSSLTLGTTSSTAAAGNHNHDGTYLKSFTEADPIFKASAAYGISAADITNWNGKTSNTGTVTSVAVMMNGSTKGTITSSGTIDLGTVLTSHQSLSAYLKIDGSNGTSAGVSALLNKLTEGSSDPQDADYYIAQYSGGGTTTTTYHRRPVSKLWNYIKGKADSVYAATNHTHSNYLTGITKNMVTTALGYTPPTANTDAKVEQAVSTSSNWRSILTGNKELSTSDTTATTATNKAYMATGVCVRPSTGTIHAKNLILDPGSNNNYSEGIRVNLANDGWAILNLGGAANSLYGAATEGWIIGRRGDNHSGSGVYGPIGSLYFGYGGSNTSNAITMNTGGSIIAPGMVHAKNGVRVGGTHSATSVSGGCQMTYNSSTQALEFVFA